jgi:hypothetical protein
VRQRKEAYTEETIARFSAETRDEEIPPATLQWANLGSFDCRGTRLAGAASPPGKMMAKFTRETGDTPESAAAFS